MAKVPQGAFECFRLWHAQAWPCVRHLRTKKKASAKCRDILELEATSIWFQAANSVQLRDAGALWLMIFYGLQQGSVQSNKACLHSPAIPP